LLHGLHALVGGAQFLHIMALSAGLSRIDLDVNRTEFSDASSIDKIGLFVRLLPLHAVFSSDQRGQAHALRGAGRPQPQRPP
jgi:hypothetical protein